jgi:uncharacterized membrane protein
MKKRFLLWSVLICVLVVAATVLVYRQLPELIPSHWNAAGEIDRHGPRGWIFTQPVVLVVLTLLWLVLPAVSPEKFRVGEFSDTYWYCGLVTAGLLAYIQAVILWGVTGGTLDMGRALPGGIGLAFILLGNVLGKVRRNFWLGVRTPWTLASDRVWYATHRVAGKTMVVGGLVTMLAAMMGLPPYVSTGALMAGALVPVVFSLVYYKRLERAGGA